jgi:hypothetical protein
MWNTRRGTNQSCSRYLKNTNLMIGEGIKESHFDFYIQMSAQCRNFFINTHTLQFKQII